MPKIIYLIACLLYFCVPLAGLKADENIDNDLTLWPVASLEFPLYKDKVSGYAYLQPTLTNNLQDLSPVVFRGALVYSLKPNLDLWAGYDRHYSFGDKVTFLENRPWQQVTYNHKYKKTTLDHRLRLEERFLEGVNDPLLRTRYRLRLTHDVGKNKKWYLAASNELHINLNTVNQTRRAGFSEDRIYAGVGRRLNAWLNLEGGYQLSFINFINTNNLLRHALVTNLSISIPYKKQKPKGPIRSIQQGPN
jgi:hypothetical protein